MLLLFVDNEVVVPEDDDDGGGGANLVEPFSSEHGVSDWGSVLMQSAKVFVAS